MGIVNRDEKSLINLLKKKIMGKKEKTETEVFIYGEITTHPICSFSNIHQDLGQMGWVYKIKTQQFIGYEYQDVEINIVTIYDMRKWDILRKGQKVKLSVLKKQESKFTDDGFALKCNVVNRSN